MCIIIDRPVLGHIVTSCTHQFPSRRNIRMFIVITRRLPNLLAC
eukprot:COSAG02_NODE_6313_length_3659_cov_122.161798_1_plen_43_part_10